MEYRIIAWRRKDETSAEIWATGGNEGFFITIGINAPVYPESSPEVLNAAKSGVNISQMAKDIDFSHVLQVLANEWAREPFHEDGWHEWPENTITSFVDIVDKDVDGCGTDVRVTLKVIGPAVTNGLVSEVEKSVSEYKKDVEDWDSDQVFAAAASYLKKKGYVVEYQIPSIEIYV
jgi:hypothetical protein